MDFQAVRPDLVKFEMRQATGTPAWAKEIKKPGFFGRLLSGLGRIAGATAAPLSFIFPPAALAAAGMYGVSAIGDQIQYNAYEKAFSSAAQRDLSNASFPGLDLGNIGIQPATHAISPQDEQIMNVLFARDQASLGMAHAI
ncbi:MAG: hypothetical protein HY609_04270 [Deltaproteobacteria bacterium]|nr:hypothetical protein [Deltaproteobacteria bacterium]MBI4224125.1 hypothetical protein [Deltaproteobacteria bacterium]